MSSKKRDNYYYFLGKKGIIMKKIYINERNIIVFL